MKAGNDDSVMSQQSARSTTSNTSSGRRRRSSARRSFMKSSAQQGDNKDIVWVGGRPMTLPSESAQAFASVPQQSADASIPTQGVTGDESVNFSLPSHMATALKTDSTPTSSGDVENTAAHLAAPQAFSTGTPNPLLDSGHPLPRAGQGLAWGTPGLSQRGPAAFSSQDEASAQPPAAELTDSRRTVSAGLGAKLKAQLAALKAEGEAEKSVEMQRRDQSEPQAVMQESEAGDEEFHKDSGLISPPDSEQGDASASEQTWTAGMGQNLGKQLQARLARDKSGPAAFPKPPVHPNRPTSEQTWTAGMGSKLQQELARLRSQGSGGADVLRGIDLSRPSVPAAPRNAQSFPAQPVPVPWTEPISEDPEETWSASFGKRMRRQLPRLVGNETSLPLPQEKPRASVFDLFADPTGGSNQQTWAADVGARMRRQLEELRQREVEDSAHTASSSSHSGELLSKRPVKRSALPSSEQTWSAGVSNEARRQSFARRSALKRNNSSPDLEDVDADQLAEVKADKSKSMQKEKELQHDSLTFHHLEEIPHVRHPPGLVPCASRSLSYKKMHLISNYEPHNLYSCMQQTCWAFNSHYL